MLMRRTPPSGNVLSPSLCRSIAGVERPRPCAPCGQSAPTVAARDSLHHRRRWSSEDTIAHFGGRAGALRNLWNGSPGCLTTGCRTTIAPRTCSCSPACEIPGAWQFWKPWHTGCRWYAPTSAGPGVIVNQDCGRVVSTGDRSQDQIVNGLVEAMREIAATPALHDSLAAGAMPGARNSNSRVWLLPSIHPSLVSNVSPIA